MGGYEPNPKPWAVDGLPDRFEFQLLDDDLDHFEPLLELAAGRVPAHADGRHQSSSSTARRASRRMATSSSARRLRCAASLSAPASTPSASPPAAAPAWRSPSGWPRASRPSTSGRSTFAGSASNHLDTGWVRTRTLEAYAKHYTMAWPFEEHRSGRPLRRSPLYDRLKAQGACFGEKLGWERPNWFADAGAGRRPRTATATDGRTGSTPSAASTPQRRERVAMFDQTSFAKFMLAGTRRRGSAVLDLLRTTSPSRLGTSSTPRC